MKLRELIKENNLDPREKHIIILGYQQALIDVSKRILENKNMSDILVEFSKEILKIASEI
jgi:hypothetical protein